MTLTEKQIDSLHRISSIHPRQRFVLHTVGACVQVIVGLAGRYRISTDGTTETFDRERGIWTAR